MPDFSTIPGAQLTKEHLSQFIQYFKTPHALLFDGVDGDASMALALAFVKSIACEFKNGNESCNNCQSCRQIESYNYPDLHFSFPFTKTEESSAANNCTDHRQTFTTLLKSSPYLTKNRWSTTLDIGNKQLTIPVKEAENIAHILSLTGYSKNARFVVIWLPELFHASASNKLLKLIEEPGLRTYFLLISHSLQNVLQTIRSRCVTIKTQGNDRDEIMQYLQEKHKINSVELAKHTIDNTTIGKNEDKILSTESLHKSSTLFVEWMRLLYQAKPLDMVQWTEAVSTLSREDQKHYLDFSLDILRQVFLLKNNAYSYGIFVHQNFDLLKFSNFIKTEKMQEILEVIDACKADIMRNGNPKLALLDTTLQLTKYIGKA